MMPTDIGVIDLMIGFPAAEALLGTDGSPGTVYVRADPDQVEAVVHGMLEPFTRSGSENPYTIQADLQETMQNLVAVEPQVLAQRAALAFRRERAEAEANDQQRDEQL